MLKFLKRLFAAKQTRELPFLAQVEQDAWTLGSIPDASRVDMCRELESLIAGDDREFSILSRLLGADGAKFWTRESYRVDYMINASMPELHWDTSLREFITTAPSRRHLKKLLRDNGSWLKIYRDEISRFHGDLPAISKLACMRFRELKHAESCS